ncbi:MAG: hypothetical protein F4Z45_13030 [Gammaproteobacteria bacterium]|nr:hypothetical protein [Gammaproteobacteria bacterium]
MLTFIPAVGLSLIAVWSSVQAIRQARTDGRSVFPSQSQWGHAGHLLLWWLGLLGVTIAAGQLIALPAFAALYVILKGRQPWWTGALYAAGAWALLYGVFEHIVGVLWYPSLLFH